MCIRDRVNHEFGLDQPLLVRYGKYMVNLVTKGDMGTSWVMQTKVMNEFVERLPNTLLLTAFALALTIFVGIPMGVYAAVKQNTCLLYTSKDDIIGGQILVSSG